MKTYLIYSTIDGDILRCGICADDDLDIQAHDGEAVMEHPRVDDTEFKVDLETLEVVPIT